MENFSSNYLWEIARSVVKIFARSEDGKHVAAIYVANDIDRERLKASADIFEHLAQVLRKRAAEHRDEADGGQDTDPQNGAVETDGHVDKYNRCLKCGQGVEDYDLHIKYGLCRARPNQPVTGA